MEVKFEKVYIAGPGTGKTYNLLKEFLEKEKESYNVLLLSTTLAPIKSFLERKEGKFRRKDNINTIFGFLARNLYRTGVITRNQLNKLQPAINYKMKKKIAKEFGLKYSSDELSFFNENPEYLNAYLNELRKIIFFGKEIDKWENETKFDEKIVKKLIEMYYDGVFYDYMLLIHDLIHKSKNIDFSKMYYKNNDYVEFDYVLIDEMQDFPVILYKYLPKKNVIVAGDPFQAIYKFLFYGYEKFYEFGKEIVKLEESRRFGVNISKIATKLLIKMQLIKNMIDYKIKSKQNDIIDLRFGKWEIYNILINILEKYDSIAILTYDNYNAKSIREFLKYKGINAIPFKENLEKIRENLKSYIKDFMEVYENPNALKLEELKQKYQNLFPEELFEYDYDVMGLKAYQNVKINAESKTIYLVKLLEHFASINKIRIKNLLTMLKKEVIVDTIHSVKGYEFDAVIIYDKMQARFRKECKLDRFYCLSVFYVGITRARKFLALVPEKKGPSMYYVLKY